MYKAKEKTVPFYVQISIVLVHRSCRRAATNMNYIDGKFVVNGDHFATPINILMAK